MTKEQKAKVYDEAVERLRNAFYDNNSRMCEEYRDAVLKIIEPIFPELKESDDERIRKWLIKDMGRRLSCWTSTEVTKEQVLAWLEKQGEQKPVVDTKVIIPKFRVGDIVKSKSQPMLSPRKIISIGKDCYWCEDRGCIGFAWEDDCEIVEQNPAWSKEDVAMLDSAIAFVEHSPFTTIGKGKNNVIAWLKNLKDKVLTQIK